ncbi:hypothetical protein EAF00_005627 [Botryotinia globosa]|nr:hypothetical protein EAF00_005627 [Botryotinia globosa]
MVSNEHSVIDVDAWLRNIRQTLKTTVDLNLALSDIKRTHISDSTQTHDKVTRRRELDRRRLQEILKKKEFCATLRALPRQANFAIRSRHLERLKTPQGRDMTIIEKGGEVAHYADALLDAVMFVPELFDYKCETPHDDELYRQTYHHSPIEIISMASHDRLESLIKVINWFARIKQWRTNRDYLKTDFVTESGKHGIYPFTAHKREWLWLPKVSHQQQESNGRAFGAWNAGLPHQPVPLDWDGLPSVSSIRLFSDESQNPIDDGWGPCIGTTKERSLEDTWGASPATLSLSYPNSMRRDWSRTTRGWRDRGVRTARGGKATRGGRVSRGSRGTGTMASRNDLPQQNLETDA